VNGLPRRTVRWAAHQRARDEMFRKDYMGFGVDELAKVLDSDDASALTTDQPDDPDRPTSCPECGFIGPPEVVERHQARTGHGITAPDAEAEAELGVVQKRSSVEERFTFGPLYSPGVLDAHGEFATADDLQKALWKFSLKGDRTLRKQHGKKTIGKIVELVQWPFEAEVELSVPGRPVRKAKLPAGTVYAGVLWDEDAWPDVKAGRITGLSMGGTAVRFRGVEP
jgi:hypothetical protein